MEQGDMKMEKHDVCSKACRCPHHKAVSACVTLFGIIFLLGALGNISMKTVDVTLGVLIIVAGLSKMCGGMCKCCENKY